MVNDELTQCNKYVTIIKLHLEIHKICLYE